MKPNVNAWLVCSCDRSRDRVIIGFMELKDWSLFIATALSPCIAVLVTLWWQGRKEKRDAKIRLFTTLMTFRKSYVISYDWANALNVIDVIFADCRDVVDCWHEFYGMLHQTNANLEARNHKYLELMSKMAVSLGFNRLQQTEIDKFYTPEAHAHAADLAWACQNEWYRVLKNTAKIEVVLNQNPPTGTGDPKLPG